MPILVFPLYKTWGKISMVDALTAETVTVQKD